MAPEVIMANLPNRAADWDDGEPIGRACDTWSIACTAIEVIQPPHAWPQLEQCGGSDESDVEGLSPRSQSIG